MKRSPAEDRLRIGHMLDAIDGIREAVGELAQAEMATDRVRVLAMERGYEILSEASRHVSEELRTTEPEIPWRQIADFGNALRHGYDSIRFALLYQGVLRDLPPLEAALRRMLDRLG